MTTAPDARGRGADLLWDTSTLRKGLQRQFFASLLEMTGSPVQIVEQTATDCGVYDPNTVIATGNPLLQPLHIHDKFSMQSIR